MDRPVFLWIFFLIGGFSLFFNLFLFYQIKIKDRKEYQFKIKKYEDEIEKKKEKIYELKSDIKVKLKKARNVHQQMLPENLIGPEDYIISDYYQPAEYIGGDYYNIFKIDHGTLDPFFEEYLIYFFDVSGHGIDSTLLSIFVNESIENYFRLRHSPGEKISTAELIDYIDRSYQEEGFPDDYLVCLFIGILDRKNNILNYSSGGFQYPIYKLSEESRVEEINIGGLPISSAIGTLKGSRVESKMKFKKNETMFLSTDGLLEQENETGIYYKRLKQILKNYKFLPAPFLNDLIKDDFYNFTNNNPGDDDITYLLLERPEAELINYDLKKDDNNIEEISSEILNFINQNLDFKDQKFKTFKRIILEVINSQNYLIKIKLLNSENLIMISFEKNKNKKDIEKLINKYSCLKLITTEESELLNLEEKKISYNQIYFSHNKNNNKIYFLIFKS